MHGTALGTTLSFYFRRIFNYPFTTRGFQPFTFFGPGAQSRLTPKIQRLASARLARIWIPLSPQVLREEAAAKGGIFR